MATLPERTSSFSSFGVYFRRMGMAPVPAYSHGTDYPALLERSGNDENACLPRWIRVCTVRVRKIFRDVVLKKLEIALAVEINHRVNRKS